jgi:hypothetical protein
MWDDGHKGKATHMTVRELFERHGLLASGPVSWGEPIPCDRPGVYVVTLSPDIAWNNGIPAPAELDSALRERWLPKQPILYIGKAGGPGSKSTLHKPIGQFTRHQHGDRSPHRGGEDVKLLLPHRQLWLFWAPVLTEPRAVEGQMLVAFSEEAGRRPFANRRD